MKALSWVDSTKQLSRPEIPASPQVEKLASCFGDFVFREIVD